MLEIKPIGFYVLVKPVPLKEKTDSGIILPESQVQQIPKGQIVAKGKAVTDEIKVGDQIQWSMENTVSQEFEHLGERHLLMNSQGIKCVLKDV